MATTLERQREKVTEQLEDTRAARTFVMDAFMRVSQIRQTSRIKSLALTKLEEAELWLNKQITDCDRELLHVDAELAELSLSRQS